MIKAAIFFLGALLLWPAVFARQTSAAATSKSTTKYKLKGEGFVSIALPTSVGLIKGQLKIKKLVLRGPEGLNPFMFRLVLDPESFTSGDSLRDQYVVQKMLKPHLGDFSLYALERIAPLWGANGKPVGDPKIKGYMDPVRKGAYVEIPYRWNPNRNGGLLRIEHETTLASLGIPKPGHPFVRVEGPLKISLLAELVRFQAGK